MSSQARARARYALGLPAFLRARPTPERCRGIVREQYGRRAAALEAIFERAVYDNPTSPYRPLLAAAGIERGDIAEMLARSGVESTLARLHEAGVRLSIDEFKGRVPIRRSGLETAPAPSDFDNPLLRRHYEARTSGSRTSSRIAIDLDLLAHESAYLSLLLDGFGLRAMPFAAWRPVLPGLAGLKGMLRRAHLGLSSEAWFTSYRHPLRPGSLRFKAMTGATIAVADAVGSGIPRPRHVPLERADRLAAWLAAHRRAGAPAYLDTNWSSAVRICNAARSEGLDITGTFFRVGGEPATPARSEALESAGCSFGADYSMGEVGWIGVACPHRKGLDDVHVAADKVAVIQPRIDGPDGSGPLLLTTVLPSCPKILINVEVGDRAVIDRRDCDCPMGSLGMRDILRSIESHEKLTTEGMNFIGSEIAWLLEVALPARFGGGVGDYQLVEDRRESLSRIGIVIDPAVDAPPDAVVTATTLELLSGLGDGQRLMAEQWRQGGTLEVRRRKPYLSGEKVQHLHVLAGDAQR